jgi:peptide methionine sulfoxide reductase MsrA
MQVSPPLFGPEDEVEDTGKQYAPSYALDSSYAATIEDWMNTYNDPTHKNVSIKVSSEECSDYKWSDVGHQEWSANSGGRYIPFFSINYDSSNSKDDTIINADKEDASVEMSINAAAVQTFPIQPGSW